MVKKGLIFNAMELPVRRKLFFSSCYSLISRTRFAKMHFTRRLNNQYDLVQSFFAQPCDFSNQIKSSENIAK